MSFLVCIFKSFFFKHHIHIHEEIFNTISINLHLIFIELNLNPTIKLNLVEFKFHSMYLNSIHLKLHAMSFHIFI
jgi:hypothetical protein